MAQPHELAKVPLRPQRGIDVKVIRRRVFVIEIPAEDGIEIQAFDAQLRQVGQAVDDAAQAAAQKVFPRRRRVPGRKRAALPMPGKPLREDLVVDAALRPTGHGDHVRPVDLQHFEVSRPGEVRLRAAGIEPRPSPRRILEPEAVPDVMRLLRELHLGGPLLRPPVVRARRHPPADLPARLAALPADPLAGGQVARRRLQQEADAVSCKRLHKRVKRKVTNRRGQHPV